MPNITISLDEELLNLGKQYAEKHQVSLDALIKKLLEQQVKPRSTNWLDECFALMDKAAASSDGQKWRREDLYDV